MASMPSALPPRTAAIYFTVDYRGKLYRLAALPTGCGLSPYYLCSLTVAFNRHLRRSNFTVTYSHGVVRRSKLSMGRRHTMRSHFRGCRILPYMHDSMFFAFRRLKLALCATVSPPCLES
eukprot:jgi/Tetstr1/429529/TSEL_019434.t1